jgi:hypothetical protein
MGEQVIGNDFFFLQCKDELSTWKACSVFDK